MALDFSTVEQTINQTKIEVTEHDAATVALEEAKAKLVVVQSQVAEAQNLVAEASSIANVQKADVVNGINSAIAALQDLLTQLA